MTYMASGENLNKHQLARRQHALDTGQKIAELLEQGYRIYIDDPENDCGFVSGISLTYHPNDDRYGGVALSVSIGEPIETASCRFMIFEDDIEWDHGMHSPKCDLDNTFTHWKVFPPEKVKGLNSYK